MHKERDRCQGNRGIPQPGTFFAGWGYAAKVPWHKVHGLPFYKEKGSFPFSCPQRGRVRAEPVVKEFRPGMPEWRDTLFKGRPKIGLDFFNAPRQRGNRTKCLVHSMGYGLCVDVQKSGTTQIQNVLDKGYNLMNLYTCCQVFSSVVFTADTCCQLIADCGQLLYSVDREFSGSNILNCSEAEINSF